MIDAVEAVEKHDVVKAALFVAAGYFTLTFYDLFALRTIGRPDIPYRIAALAGFTSYAVGHNVGASAFTGGAVRYRIYSRLRPFGAIDVAKICFIAGLTFWLGNATVLGLGVAWAPRPATAIDLLPLGSTAPSPSASCRSRDLCRLGLAAPRACSAAHNWTVTLPNGPLTLLQILVGIRRPRLLRCRDVHAGARRALYRLRHPGGDLRCLDPPRLCEPLPRAASASSTPPCWSPSGNSIPRICSPGLLLFRLLYYLVPFAISLADPRRGGSCGSASPHRGWREQDAERDKSRDQTS